MKNLFNLLINIQNKRTLQEGIRRNRHLKKQIAVNKKMKSPGSSLKKTKG